MSNKNDIVCSVSNSHKNPNLEVEDNSSKYKRVTWIVTVVVRGCGKHGVPAVGAFGAYAKKERNYLDK